MRSNKKINTNMLAVAVMLLSLAYLYSCSMTREINNEDTKLEKADSTKVFVPTHPPVVVPHSWRDALS